MGVMRILDHTGDTMVKWALDDPATMVEAERIFFRLQAEGKMAFARPQGGSSEDMTMVRNFDPAADEIIWVRPIQGG